MNYTALLEEVKIQIAFYLDKLKVSNPLVYVLVQICIFGLLAAFTFNKINISETIDAVVITLLLAITSTVSPRTSLRAETFKERKAEDLQFANQKYSKSEYNSLLTEEYENTKSEEGPIFPNIDQSNN